MYNNKNYEISQQEFRCNKHQEKCLLMNVKGLRKAFGGQQVLDNINLELYKGQVILLQGSNGSGKTTLLNILTGNLEPDEGCIELFTNGFRKTFHFPRGWIQKLNPWDHFLPEKVSSEGVGRSWQETRLFNSLKLIDNIAVAEKNHPGEKPGNLFFQPTYVKKAERTLREKCKDQLVRLGLGDLSDSFGEKVSLGQSKRVSIARSVQAGMKVLFLDEPLSGLDASGVTQVIQLLHELVTKEHVTLVIVEHVFNIQHVYPIVDTIWTLKDGSVSIKNKEIIDKSVMPGIGIEIDYLFSEFKFIRQEDLGRGATLEIYRHSEISETEEYFIIKNLIVHRGRRLAVGQVVDSSNRIKGVSFKLSAGDVAILKAPNGWGKTTLLDALAGLIPATEGMIRLSGKLMNKLSSWERAAEGMNYLRSDSRAFPSLTLSEISRVVGRKDLLNKSDSRTNKMYGGLSGGEKQKFRLAISRMENLAMFDEPFSALDKTYLSTWSNEFVATMLKKKPCCIIAIPSVVEK